MKLGARCDPDPPSLSSNGRKIAQQSVVLHHLADTPNPSKLAKLQF